MKKLIISTMVLIVWASQLSAQHIPPCQGEWNHSRSYCYGYASARAFGRTWSDSRCPASTLYLNKIEPKYFDHYTPFSADAVQQGDIIEFDGHVAYVSSTWHGILVDQVEGEGQPEQQDLPLDWVINGHSNPTVIARGNPLGYYRKKPAWPIIVENLFGTGQPGGKVKVAGVEYDSPHSRDIHWETEITISAIEDGKIHYGYRQIFQQWRRDESLFDQL